jgi:hypothetical protein
MKKIILDSYTTTILHTKDNIIIAQQLLYEIYIKEMGWKFINNNPSSIRIETSNDNKKIMTDDYDQHATWVGTFYNEQLVGCGRVVNRDAAGLLEIERYSILNSLREKICVSSVPNLVELNRSAIVQSHRNSIIWPCLLYFAFKYCENMSLCAIATTASSRVDQFHSAIGFHQIKGQDFFYHNQDEKSVNVYFADTSNIKQISLNLERILKNKKI